MFFHTVEIPRITAAQIAELNQNMPGLSNVVKLAPITTQEAAFNVAERSTNKVLATSEYVSRIKEVEETETGWKFRLEIHGD